MIKKLVIALSLLSIGVTTFAAEKFDVKKYEAAVDKVMKKMEEGVAQGPLKDDWEDIKKHNAAPEWFRDAKFGIYFHWGVYSVPATGNEWYPRNMYVKEKGVEGHAGYLHHVKTYGEPDKFTYADFVPMFKAEKFDAEEWADVFKRSGARFAGPAVEHHDGFSLWASKLTPWNSVERGPKRDVTAEIAKAIRARGMRLITTFHHGRNFLEDEKNGHYCHVKRYFPDLLNDPEQAYMYGYMPQDKFMALWTAKVGEVIDNYQPDVVWFDSWLGRVPDEYNRRWLAYYFNQAKKSSQEVVICSKTSLPREVRVLDFERGGSNRLTEDFWMDDQNITRSSWSYVTTDTMKTSRLLIHYLVDRTSKNGCLLLSLAPKADGTIPDEQKKCLEDMGDWLKVNGEAIYATRPWLAFGQGPTRMRKSASFVWYRWKDSRYKPEDIRFTRSKDSKNVYAIALGWPKGEKLTILPAQVENASKGVVTLLGYEKKLTFAVNDKKQVVIDVPKLEKADRPCKSAYVFKLSGFTFALHPDTDKSWMMVMAKK